MDSRFSLSAWVVLLSFRGRLQGDAIRMSAWEQARRRHRD